MRVTEKVVRENVAKCHRRGHGGGRPGFSISISQSEMVRGEPRTYWVQCAASGGYLFCDCAQPDGRDCPSERQADIRAAWIEREREFWIARL